MTEFIYLSGSDDVRNAGNRISSAATEMSRAAASMEESLYRHRVWLQEWSDELLIQLSRLIAKGGDDEPA